MPAKVKVSDRQMQEAMDSLLWEVIQEHLDAREMSFDQLSVALNTPPWELTVAREAISSRVDLSTGRHVRLYRASY